MPLKSLIVPTSNLVPNSTLVGTVAIDAPADVLGRVVLLSSSDSAVVVPNQVTILPGATSATFTITCTDDIQINQEYSIRAQVENVVLRQRFVGIGERFVTLGVVPNPLVGGQSATLTIKTPNIAPIGGVLIGLKEQDNDLFKRQFLQGLPLGVLIPQGEDTVSLTVKVGPVPFWLVISIDMSSNGSVLTESIAVVPNGG